MPKDASAVPLNQKTYCVNRKTYYTYKYTVNVVNVVVVHGVENSRS